MITPQELAREFFLVVHEQFKQMGRGLILLADNAPGDRIDAVDVYHDAGDFDMPMEQFSERFLKPCAAAIANSLSNRFPVGGGPIQIAPLPATDESDLHVSVANLPAVGLCVRAAKAYSPGAFDESGQCLTRAGWYTRYEISSRKEAA